MRGSLVISVYARFSGEQNIWQCMSEKVSSHSIQNEKLYQGDSFQRAQVRVEMSISWRFAAQKCKILLFFAKMVLTNIIVTVERI